MRKEQVPSILGFEPRDCSPLGLAPHHGGEEDERGVFLTLPIQTSNLRHACGIVRWYPLLHPGGALARPLLHRLSPAPCTLAVL